MPSPPQARKKPLQNQRHGISWTDDYAWLHDLNWQAVIKDPSLMQAEIREYLEAENDYTEAVMSSAKHLREELFTELKGRIAEDDQSVPQCDGDYAYYTRFLVGKQHPVFCRHPLSIPEHEEILLDANVEEQAFNYFNISACEHSPNHRYLAYCIDTRGGESYTLRIRDLKTGTDMATAILDVQGSSIAWANHSSHLMYVKLNDDYRPESVRLHRLNTAVETDITLYHEHDSGFFLNIYTTCSKRFIAINVHDHTTSEIRLVNASAPEQPALLIQARETDIEYHVEERNGELWIVTNADDCEDYKLCKTSLDNPQRKYWQDVLVPPAGVLLKEIWVTKEFIARLEMEQALPRLVVTAADGSEHTIAFAETAYDLTIVPTYEYQKPLLRFTYASMTTPRCTYDYDMHQRSRTLLKQDVIPDGHKPDDYVTERIYASTKDGATIPISMLYRKNRDAAQPSPLLLYGYGAYGYSVPAGFSPHRFSLVNRGFVYAIVHIRGGMEKGYAWYRNGKKFQKNNTFSDFIAAAEHLIKHNYTRHGHIAIHGGSAGGMLIGAVLNQRPDLFMAAIADVPFVDVLNTMCDAGLPLTPPEWNEWGNPIQSAKAFQYICSYSPYDNVTAQDYPDILVTAGVSDPRVTYWEPAKWVAKLRAMKTDQRRLLLKTNMSAGHAGAAGRFDYLHELALMYAFILKVFNENVT